MRSGEDLVPEHAEFLYETSVCGKPIKAKKLIASQPTITLVLKVGNGTSWGKSSNEAVHTEVEVGIIIFNCVK